MCKASWDSEGGGGEWYPTAQNVTPGRGQTLAFGFLLCSLEFFFQYNEIISTSKLPFHNPLVMKYYKILAYFSLDYDIGSFTNSFGRFFEHLLYIFNTHKLHGH